MKRNPDDLTLLHRIRFKVRQYAGGVAVDVYDGSDRIGMGKFFFGPITDLAPHKKLIVSPALIEVQKPWRRKGVASAIYRKVESLGYTIHPSSSQTPDGVRLWRGGRWSKRDEVVNSGIMSRWKTEYARTNPGGYENFWIEQNGKVHRSEDEYHVEMASRLTDSDEEWAMKAAFDVSRRSTHGGPAGFHHQALEVMQVHRVEPIPRRLPSRRERQLHQERIRIPMVCRQGEPRRRNQR